MEQCFKKMNFCCYIYRRISSHEVSCLCTFSYRPQEGKKKKKGKLRKEDISLPTNFQHISHVGWDPNKGFDLENVDPKLKQFFSKAGKSIITYCPIHYRIFHLYHLPKISSNEMNQFHGIFDGVFCFL